MVVILTPIVLMVVGIPGYILYIYILFIYIIIWDVSSTMEAKVDFLGITTVASGHS